MHQVTRKQFQAAIEAGLVTLEESSVEPNFDIEKLREVGRTATTVACGNYHACVGDRYVGCPVAQAFEEYGSLVGDLSFTRGYDRTMSALLPYGTRVFEVI